MNKFDRKIVREANKRQDTMYNKIESKYPDETIIITLSSGKSKNFNKIFLGPNVDNYINDIISVPSIYKLKKQIRKELKNK